MKIKLPILIVGLGKSGHAALRLLLAQGIPRTEIKTFDSKSPADFSAPEALSGFSPKTLVVSPGVPLQTAWIQSLLKSGADLMSEIALAAEVLTSEKVIGITGSMGKSTTTTLLGIGVQAFSDQVFVGGNLGFPLADYAADVLEKKRPVANWIILELSSYQLENAGSLKMQAGILTALSPNHLERYDSLESYYSTKWQMKERINGFYFLNFDNQEVRRWCTDKADRSCKKIVVKDYDLSDANLIGEHNKQNLALAFAIAKNFNWPPSAFKAMNAFTGMEHRIELVHEVNGTKFINDSKATTIESVLAAVEACTQLELPIHLFVGGRDKNLPWEDLAALKNQSGISLYFFGECAQTAKNKSGLTGDVYPSLSNLLSSFRIKKESVVLLSPGGSSLDEFRNFEERGHFFKKWALSDTSSRF